MLMAASTASRPGASRGACAGVALLSALVVFAWTAARIHYACDGNWTALFCTGTALRVPPDLDAGTYRFEGHGYDGQFYRNLAHDPSLQKGYYRYMDAPQRWCRRLLVPLAAWAFGFGQRDWIDGAYIALELLFLALGTYWCARLLARRGRSPLWGLLFVVVPATVSYTHLSCRRLLHRWRRVWNRRGAGALRLFGLLFLRHRGIQTEAPGLS